MRAEGANARKTASKIFENILEAVSFIFEVLLLGCLVQIVEDDIENVGVGWVLLHPIHDGDARYAAPFDLLEPFHVLATIGIDDDATAFELLDIVDTQILTASRGEPYEIGTEHGHDDCRLLALDDADRFVGELRQQVFAKEALREGPVLRQLTFSLERGVDPSRVASAVAIGAVLHDLASVHPILCVYLPEDDLTQLCGTEAVELPYVLGLLFVGDERG